MGDSIFTHKRGKEFNSIASKKAEIANKERTAVEEFMKETDSDTMDEIFSVIERYGHPSEKTKVNAIKEKYRAGEDLEFDDIMSLDMLYRSNCQHKLDKGDNK